MDRVVKRSLPTVAFITAFVLFTGAAGAACRSVPARTWRGNVAFAHLGGNGFGNLTEQYFQQNGCDWKGQRAFNGFDAAVLDVSRYAGLGMAVRWSAANALPNVPTSMEGYFLNRSCGYMIGSGFQSLAPGAWVKFAAPRARPSTRSCTSRRGTRTPCRCRRSRRRTGPRHRRGCRNTAPGTRSPRRAGSGRSASRRSPGGRRSDRPSPSRGPIA